MLIISIILSAVIIGLVGLAAFVIIEQRRQINMLFEHVNEIYSIIRKINKVLSFHDSDIERIENPVKKTDKSESEKPDKNIQAPELEYVNENFSFKK